MYLRFAFKVTIFPSSLMDITGSERTHHMYVVVPINHLNATQLPVVTKWEKSFPQHQDNARKSAKGVGLFIFSIKLIELKSILFARGWI